VITGERDRGTSIVQFSQGSGKNMPIDWEGAGLSTIAQSGAESRSKESTFSTDNYPTHMPAPRKTHYRHPKGNAYRLGGDGSKSVSNPASRERDYNRQL